MSGMERTGDGMAKAEQVPEIGIQKVDVSYI
jgi:hypothetical protein